ncbi:MAG: TonB-dependent receptor [Bacteroidales bacterium]|nr:TonB-dependent receptor [Bacteroidales bacterium]
MLHKKLFTALALLLGVAMSAFAQKQTVSGTVLDASGPVIGVVVQADGASAVTDADGKFTISVSPNAVLEFSCLGYETVTEPVNGRKNITVTLKDDSLLLEDAIVVGYGVQKKENLTGAVSVVNAESIAKRSSANLGSILQGTVPGLTITTPTGRPGASVDLNIRGWNSINSGSPLVLVDGVVGSLDRVNPSDVESISVLKDASSAAVYGAKAAFGVVLVTTKSGGDNEGRATVTYSGRWGWSTPTTSTDWETRGYDVVRTANIFSKNYNGSTTIKYTDEDMQELWIRRGDVTENPARPWVVLDDANDGYKYYANTDWWHYFFTDVKPTQNHDISFRGGTKTIKYYLSANYNQEQGIFRINPDKFRKYNLRARFSFDAKPWLNISNNTAFYTSTYNYPGLADQSDAFYKCTAGYFSYMVPVTPEGTFIIKDNYGGGGQTILGNLNNENFKNQQRTSNLTNTTEITVKPIKQLEIKGNYTYSLNNYSQLNRSVNGEFAATTRMKTTIQTTGDNEDKLSEQAQTVDQHSANLYATYTDTFADAHHLKVMLGGQYESYRHKKLSATAYNLLSEDLNDQNLVGTSTLNVSGPVVVNDVLTGETATVQYEYKRYTTGGGQSEYALLGFFGRINYDYKGKYLLELSGRYDGTSRFPRGQRFGFFPSASLGWRISEEPFWAPLKSWWNDAKLRFSYGSLGNQQVGYYDYIRSVTLGTQDYLFGGDKSATATFGAPVAGNLTWETVQQKNLGLDLAFLDNRITFTGEAYIRDTKNMLTTGKALPSVYGASAPKTNNADLRTLGYELALTYRNRFMLLGKPFEYNVGGTFNDYIGYITKFDNPTKDLSTYYVGMRYGEIWGYLTDGFFASDAEAAAYPVDQSPINTIIAGNGGLRAGDLKYRDLDGDNIISTGANTVDNSGDRRIIGNSQPRYQFGVTLGFNWNGIDFSAFFQGVGRQDWYPSSDARYFWGLYARPFSSWIQKDFLAQCWSEENPDAYFPRPRAYIAFDSSGKRALAAKNDRYLQNLGYCRLKNLTVGYTLPQKWTKKVEIESVRMYFSGENLFYISPGLHCDYIDPEAAAKTAGKYPIYPWQKTLTFGIDITF